MAGPMAAVPDSCSIAYFLLSVVALRRSGYAVSVLVVLPHMCDPSALAMASSLSLPLLALFLVVLSVESID